MPEVYARISALTVYDNRLIAGGSFAIAGGVAAKNIAAWDGTTWSPMAEGIAGDDYIPYVQALVVHENRLYAGGQFQEAGDTPASYIASWNGLGWSPLGSGLNYYVETLVSSPDQLIVGGGFTEAGGELAASLAGWTKQFECGDADGSVIVNISDAVFLIRYLLSGGPAPPHPIAGDANCDQIVDLADASYLVSYIFVGGPAPCVACQ